VQAIESLGESAREVFYYTELVTGEQISMAETSAFERALE
jgi:hypothetical protein